MSTKNSIMVPDSIVEEVQQAFVEGEFSSRWALIEAYHHAGKAILSINRDRTQVLQELAQKVGRSVRTLWYAAKFAEVYPDIEKLPEGKDVSMNKIITKYLTTTKEEECAHPDDQIEIISFKKCKSCGHQLGKVK